MSCAVQRPLITRTSPGQSWPTKNLIGKRALNHHKHLAFVVGGVDIKHAQKKRPVLSEMNSCPGVTTNGLASFNSDGLVTITPISEPS